MQKETDVNQALKRYQNRLIDSINGRFTQASSLQDPLSFITSKDGQWLFNSPLLQPDQFTHVITLATAQLNQKIHNINTQYHCNNDDDNIYFYLNEQQVIRWKLSTNQVSVPLFRKIYENQQRLQQLNQQLTDIRQQIYEANIILSNPDSLIDHGMYLAYLKASFTKRHYQAESQAVLDNLSQTETNLLTKIKSVQNQAEQLANQQHILDQYIHQIELSTAGFPYKVNFQRYLKAKNRKK